MSSVLGATGLVLGNVQGQGDFVRCGSRPGRHRAEQRRECSGMVLGTSPSRPRIFHSSGTVRGDLIAEDGVEIAEVDRSTETSPHHVSPSKRGQGARSSAHRAKSRRPHGAALPSRCPAEPSEEVSFEAASATSMLLRASRRRWSPPRAALLVEGALARRAAPRRRLARCRGARRQRSGAKRRRKRRRDRDRDRESATDRARPPMPPGRALTWTRGVPSSRRPSPHPPQRAAPPS